MSVVKSKRESRKTGTSLSDERLWEAFTAGEDSAYTLLYFRYADRLYAYLKLVLASGPDRHMIDDVFQDTWMRIYREREKFQIKGQGTFAGWIFRIAHNFAISLFRRPHNMTSLQELGEENKYIEQASANAYEPLVDAKSAEEVLGLLQETVDSLPVMLKEVYVLSELEQFSMEKLAETLGISKANAKVRLFRARKLVRARLLDALGMTDTRNDDDE